MSTKNLMLKFPRKLYNQNMGPFKVFKLVGPTAYKLGLSHSIDLKTIQLVFHVTPLRDFVETGLK